MLRLNALGLLAFLLLIAGLRVAAAQGLPAFCESVDVKALGGTEAPYSRHVAPDGTIYCEGILSGPIAFPPPEVISVKQDQPLDVTFAVGTKAVLTWSSKSPADQMTHVKLRALKEPLFALDAAIPATKFEWNSNLIARLQPSWDKIASLVTQQIDVMGKKEHMVIPVRQGPGCTNSYTLLIRSGSPIHLTTALVEPINGKSAFPLPISSKPGPVPNTWLTTISFSNRPQGVFRLSLGEGIHQFAAVADAIYLLVAGCPK